MSGGLAFSIKRIGSTATTGLNQISYNGADCVREDKQWQEVVGIVLG